MRRVTKTKGFTLVELLIATTILSIVLLGASIVAVQIGRLYYKGVITARTQNTARNLVDGISRPIQLEGSSVAVTQDFSSPGTTYTDASGVARGYTVVCVGVQRYTVAVNAQQAPGGGGGKIAHAVWRDEIPNLGTCLQNVPNLNSAVPSGVKGTGLLEDNMRVSAIDVSNTDDLWAINLTVAYGDNDSLEDNGTPFSQCKSNYTTSQFCAVTTYNTKVSRRISGD